MRPSAFLLILSAFAVTADAATALKPALAIQSDAKSGRRLYSMTAINMPVADIARRLSTELEKKIVVEQGVNVKVSLILRDASEERLVQAVAEQAGLKIVRSGSVLRLQRAEATVTMDVKDADIRQVLELMRRQCAIRNLVIDPEVKGNGTFLFKNVPCSEAFRAVLATQGLAADFSSNSVASVRSRN